MWTLPGFIDEISADFTEQCATAASLRPAGSAAVAGSPTEYLARAPAAAVAG
jgi:hypothetical protein